MISRKALEEELKSLESGCEEEFEKNMQAMITRDVLDIYDAICKVADRGGHSGSSFSYMMNLANQLIHENQLINPILDIDENPDDWRLVPSGVPDKSTVYQNKRKSSVFCTIDADGHKVYKDHELAFATDNNGETWYSTYRYGMFEIISVPYLPDGKQWFIYEKPTSSSPLTYTIEKIEKR